MKKKYLLRTLLLSVLLLTGGGRSVFAETGTEKATNTGTANTTITGTCYSVDGTYIAGKGGIQGKNMVNKGVKFRTGQNGNTLVFTVNSGYTITGFKLYGISNYALKGGASEPCISVTKVEVDGTETASTGTNTFADKNATTVEGSVILNNISATQSIKIYFDNTNSSGNQINAYYELSWSKESSGPGQDPEPATFDPSSYYIVKEYGFEAMPTTTLAITNSAAGKIWNAANGVNNNVFRCTNTGLESLAIQAAYDSEKRGWKIEYGSGKGLLEGSKAGRCAAICDLKAGQIIEFFHTSGTDFFTRNNNEDNGAKKTELLAESGHHVYQLVEDGMVGFEMTKGKYLKKVIIYTEKKAETENYEETSFTISVGEVYKSGRSLDFGKIKMTFGGEGGADFGAGKKSEITGYTAMTEGNGGDGTSATGTFYTFEPQFPGTIEVGVVLNASKSFYITEDGTALDDFNGIQVSEKKYGTFTFPVKGGKKYKVYAAGTKLGFYGFRYTVNQAANIAEFKALPLGTEAILTLTNAKVTFNSGEYAYYVEDATGGIEFTDFEELRENRILNGTIIGKQRSDYNDYLGCFNRTASSTLNKLTITEAQAQPTTATLAQVMQESSVLRYMKLENVTVSKTDLIDDFYQVNSNGASIIVFGTGVNELLADKHKLESIAGIVIKKDDEYRLMVMQASDIVAGEDQSLKKVNSIAEFKQLANGEEAELVLTDAYVTYSVNQGLKSRLAAPARNYENRKQMILEDATGAILFNSSIVILEKGQKVNGTISAKKRQYYYLPVSMMEDMDLTSMDGITSIEEEEITPTKYADVKDLQEQSRLLTKVRVGRSTTTDSDIEGIKELHTGSSMIYLESYNIFTGETINFPEQLEYVEGFVMGEVESGLERSRSAVRAMTQTATGKIVYYIIPSDFKEYKDLVTDYIADKQTEGDKMLKGDQRKVTGVIMTATEDMPITADQKTIGEKQFNSKVEGNNFQFDATRNGKLTVYLEKKQKQPVTVAEDGEPMKDFNGITMDGEFIEIPVVAGKTYIVSTTDPTLNLRGFSFADDGTSNGDLARNIATFKALYDGMMPAEATLTLNDAMVTFIKGDQVFVEDESGATVFYKTGIQFYKDQKLNGTIAGISTAEKNMPQLLSSAKTNYKTFKATKDSAASKAITVAETQLQENIARFVKLADVISTKDKYGFRILSDSLGNTVRIEDRFNVFYELPDTLESIEGIIGIDAEGTFFLWPTSKEGVVKKVVEPETPDNPENPDNPDNPDQPDQPDQPTYKECDVTYAIAEGETHTAGEAVTVSDEDSEEVVTLTFGFAGGADFKAGKKDAHIDGFTAFTEGNGENGTATSGTNYIISPKYDGTVTVGVVLNANKSFFVEEDGTALADYNGIKADPKYYGTYSFDVKGGSTYAVYCTGSKLGFYGLNYHYAKGTEPEEPELTYELVKTLDFTTATYAADPTIVLASESCGTAYDTGNKKQQLIYAATAPEEIAGSIAFQAVSNGSGKGWWIRPAQGGLWSYNAGRSAAVLGLTAGYRVIFNCTTTATDIMSLTNANGDSDGPFTYELSEDGKQFVCTMIGDGNIGFCGNKSKGYISSIEIYKPSIEVTVADYTVKYVDTDGNELKEATTHQGLTGTAATISETDKEQITIDGITYLYDSDDAEGKTINKDGSTVITVKFAAVTNDLAYTVQEVAAGQVVRETKGTDIPGATIKVPYRRYNVVDGTLYEKGATSKEYNYSFKLNSDNQVEQLAYNATDKTNVIFLTEGEDIEGMTPCTSNNTFIRSSNAGSGYAAEGDVELVTLSAGTYTLTGVLFDAAKNPDSYWQFMAGDTEVANLHNTTNNTHVATQEFTLTETATITITKAGSGTCGIDLLYIQSTDGQVAEKEQPLVYSWESPEGTPIETGGKIAYVNGDGDRLNYKNGDYYTICLNGKKANLNDEAASANAGHMVVTLDNPLKENDVIAITAYITKNSSAKSSAYIVFENGTTAESPVYSDEANIHADFGGAITTTTVVVPAEAAGCKTITLTRGQTGTNLFITKLEITREVGEPTTAEDPELVAPDGWVSMISNGNLATDVTSNFFAKEAPASDPTPAVVTEGAGKNGSRGIKVQSADDPSQAWDTQFWIKLNEALPSGTKLHVEFDYKASKAAKASTQSHGEPGAYQHWAAIGDVNFTDEWQHFSTEFEVSGDMAGANGLLSIAFNLAEEKTATEYCFDNFGVWAQKPAPVSEWVDIAVNGTLDQENIANECFYVTEQGVGGPYLAEPVKGLGKDGGYAIKVQSADNPSQDWDSQFFIRMPYKLPAGTKFRVSFDYMADKAGDFDTQAHAEPGGYIHWAAIGSGSFTTEWQHYEKEVSVSGDMSKADNMMQSIAFNLAKNKAATRFVFDNIKIEVPSDVLATLTQNPSLKPVLDPTLIEVAQDQGKSLDTFERTGFEEGENFNTYTATGDLQVAFKMYDIDVADCDYVVVKFAEPVKAGWCVAFWAQGGTDNVGVAEGATEYKYVFADDQKCAVQNDVLPQICMLTLWGAQKPLVANIRGIYKHQIPTVVDKVDGIANNVIDDGAIYNLRGQKVTGTLKPGLYIKNGRKVVIK